VFQKKRPRLGEEPWASRARTLPAREPTVTPLSARKTTVACCTCASVDTGDIAHARRSLRNTPTRPFPGERGPNWLARHPGRPAGRRPLWPGVRIPREAQEGIGVRLAARDKNVRSVVPRGFRSEVTRTTGASLRHINRAADHSTIRPRPETGINGIEHA
jgi:hypothetical protein